MKFLSIASLAFVGITQCVSAQDVDESAGERNYYPVLKRGVRATFTSEVTGAKGDVTIYDSTNISADIEITDFLKIEEVLGWNTCSSGGLVWSLEADWSSANDEAFGDDCSDLGGTYDPNFACSELSAQQTICGEIELPNYSMIEYLTYLTSKGLSFPGPGKPPCAPPTPGVYTCNKCLYEQFSSTCEVGDFSGKYGNLMFNTGCIREAAEDEEGAVATGEVDQAAGRNYNYCHQGTYTNFETHDRFMDKPSVFRARSIKLSCNDGTPLMCAKLNSFHGY